MPPKRRLQGIAALSAGALAASFASPAVAADPTDDASSVDPIAAAASEAALREWEAARGIDVPDDLFYKLGDASAESENHGALLKFMYRPATASAEAAIVKYDYGVDLTGDAFGKVEYDLGDPLVADLMGGLQELFPKVTLSEGTADGDDPSMKPGDLGTDWAYQMDDLACDDAFFKLQGTLQGDDDAFVAWQYDAVDLVERSLVERVEAGELDDDAEVPLGALIEEVRALRGVAATVNPFVQRDRGLRALPLPKKLPADAGTYATPRAGRWRAVNLPGTVRCGSARTRIPRSVSDGVTLEVLDGGQRLAGRDIGEKGSRFVVTADPEITGRFTGTVNIKAQGGQVDMDLTMQLITDQHLVGTAEVTVRSAGQRCTITRGFDVKHRGK